jgi:quercetin dioxygenase-like cupin family protein
MRRQLRIIIGLGVVIAAGGAGFLIAAAAPQSVGVVRHVLLKEDISIPGREAVMVMVELPPGAAEGRHTHAAEVFAFVLEGAPTLEVEGRPTRALQAGDVFRMPPNAVHQAINKGGDTVRMAAVFIAEQGKPLTTQAP